MVDTSPWPHSSRFRRNDDTRDAIIAAWPKPPGIALIGTMPGNKIRPNYTSPASFLGSGSIFHSSISRAVFPASDDSNSITGEMLLISGGLSLDCTGKRFSNGKEI